MPLPTVQLLHTLPDGSTHIDWMLADREDADAPLVTFRLLERIDELSPGERMAAQRLADHRRLYLDYAGPISGGRGRVDQIARGWIDRWDRCQTQWTLAIRWPHPAEIRQHLRLVQGEAGWEVFSLAPQPSER